MSAVPRIQSKPDRSSRCMRPSCQKRRPFFGHWNTTTLYMSKRLMQIHGAKRGLKSKLAYIQVAQGCKVMRKQAFHCKRNNPATIRDHLQAARWQVDIFKLPMPACWLGSAVRCSQSRQNLQRLPVTSLLTLHEQCHVPPYSTQQDTNDCASCVIDKLTNQV